ncbi:hypothetical protein F183_A17800 [Bryobacterales bacterium F-183]|nr:hypothetical protein F183_A17800 [Bryobacterales bacterium F-183]
MLKRFILWLARVPADPEAPAGSPESIRVFRASPNLFYWNLVSWGFLQLAFAIAMVLLLVALARMEVKLPAWGKVAASVGQAVIVVYFLTQLVVSAFKQKIDYEMRWYIVTDRSLRIRSGIFFVREATMTFANIQRVNLTQGPLQKLLGIADVEVSTAGGGGAGQHGGKGAGMTNLHVAIFEGVSNAQEIRDLILDRLRKYRDAGLGDPDDTHHHHPEPHALEHPASEQEYAAAQAVLAEVRQLGAALTRK